MMLYILIVTLMLSCYQYSVDAYVTSHIHSSMLRKARATCYNSASNNMNKSAKDELQLEVELENFFESANLQGSGVTSKLTIEERAERTSQALFLEEEIYDARERLQELQSQYMADNKSVDINEIETLINEINGLKDDYILLVGATDLPLYFGRVPDALQ